MIHHKGHKEEAGKRSAVSGQQYNEEAVRSQQLRPFHSILWLKADR